MKTLSFIRMLIINFKLSILISYIKGNIEVKGGAGEDPVKISENEMNRLRQLADIAWLFVVSNCKSEPKLFRIQNTGKKLMYKELSKGIQYLVLVEEWKSKSKK